jgi:glycerol uptake facilitator-like aquaporin
LCGMPGHMNPAVTLALCLNGRITVLRTLFYWGELPLSASDVSSSRL